MKPNNPPVTGTVQNIFAHRFTLRTAEGVVLADLTPHGEEKIKLIIGDDVTIEGERKPSEIKVNRIRRGDFTLTIERPEETRASRGIRSRERSQSRRRFCAYW